jgi:hypothetical protein
MSLRRMTLMLLTVLLVACAGPDIRYTPEPASAQGSQDVADVSVFYNALSPYGTWVMTPEYGQVWIPQHVSAHWQPYTAGRWVYTDYGWTWVSDWEWGWAPFHYGRWTHISSYGWAWIPGTVWAPAWVAWRYGPGWVGWAPLPPQVVLPPSGVITQVEVIPPFWFAFVEERRFVEPHIHGHIVRPARNATLIQVTHNVTNYVVIENRVVNRCIPVQRIERVTTRPVPRMRVVDQQPETKTRRPLVKDKEREVIMYRPKPWTTTPFKGTMPTTPPIPRQSTPGTERQKPQRQAAPPKIHATPRAPQPTQPQPSAPEPAPAPSSQQHRVVPRVQEERDVQKYQRPGQSRGQQPVQPSTRPPQFTPPATYPQQAFPHRRVVPQQAEPPQGRQTPPLPQSPPPSSWSQQRLLHQLHRPQPSVQPPPSQPTSPPRNVIPSSPQWRHKFPQNRLQPEAPPQQQQ